MQPTEIALRQTDPVAREIVLGNVRKLPQRRIDGIDSFAGLDEAWWEKLYTSHPQQFAELVRICRRDYPTYAALLLKVVGKGGGGTIPFIFNRPQRYLWAKVVSILQAQQALFLCILKARQFGISTFWAGFHHWQAWRQPDVSTMMVAHEGFLRDHLVDILRVYHEQLPTILKPDTAKTMQGAKATIPAQKLEYRQFAGRPWRSAITTYVAKNLNPFGIQSTHILESEYSGYPNAAELNAALLPQLPPPGTDAYRRCSVVVESTPKGRNDFYDLCKTAQERPGRPWHFSCLPWYINSDEYTLSAPKGWVMGPDEKALKKLWSAMREEQYDGLTVTDAQMHWREQEIMGKYKGDQDIFDREYISDPENGFLLMSHSVFAASMRKLQRDCDQSDTDAIEFWKDKEIKTSGPVIGDMDFGEAPSPFESHPFIRPKITFERKRGGRLTVWKGPVTGHIYTIGIDTSAGLGGDNAVAHVLDVSVGEQAAEYADNHTGPEDMADIAVALGYWFNYAMLMPEINTYGAVTMKRMIQVWHYGNVGREEKWDETGLKKNKYGVYLSGWNKDVVIANLIDFIRKDYVRIASRELLSELSTFDYVQDKDGSDDYKAQPGRHDDRVFSMAHACYAVKQSPKVMAHLNEKRKIPTAVELGLSHQPTFEEIVRKDESMGRDLVAAMGGDERVAYRAPSWRVTRRW